MTSRSVLTAFLFTVASTSWAGGTPVNSPVPTQVEAPLAELPVLGPDEVPKAQETTPISVSFDIPPGYRNSVFFEVPESGTFEFSIKNLQLNPSAKWKPTSYLAFVSNECDVRYFLNLSVDTELNKSYARVRLIDMKEKKELFNATHQKLYDLDHEFRVSGKIEGKAIHMFVDGELVDQRELMCEPVQIELGASSGKFVASVIEQPLPPAPE